MSCSEILDFIKFQYRQLFLEKVANLKSNISVVEFNLEGNQYFIDIDNNVYEMDRSKIELHGFCVGHMKNGVIFLG